MKKILSLLLALSIVLMASPKELVKKFNISPAKFPSKKWERVFKKDSKLKKLGITGLSKDEKSELLEYLINHALDSDQPEVAGI